MQVVLRAGSVTETLYCTQQTEGLTWGMTLRAINTAEAIAGEPGWMASFLASLARDDLAPATLRGYRYDLRHFLAWQQSEVGKPMWDVRLLRPSHHGPQDRQSRRMPKNRDEIATPHQSRHSAHRARRRAAR